MRNDLWRAGENFSGSQSPANPTRRIAPPVFLIGALLLVALTGSFRSAHTQEIELAFVGDVMLGRGVAAAHADGSWDQALESLAPTLRHADLAIANLESPVTELPLVREVYDLRASPESISALQSSGLDLLGIANNHTFDSGQAGAEETYAALMQAGLTTIGPGLEPTWMRVRGERLAFLACEDVTQPIEIDRLLEAIQEARVKADYVIVSIHWGMEYAPAPSSRERDLARQMATAGADLIIGHHPHVVQSSEWIDVEGQQRQALVAYSLGNALFDQPSPPGARKGELLVVRLGPGGVRESETVPFTIDVKNGKAVLP